MLDCFLAFALLVFVWLFYTTVTIYRRSKQRKCSKIIPLLQCLPYVLRNERPEVLLSNLSKIYGNVFTLQAGSHKVVGCCGARAVRTVLLNKHLSDRPRGDFLRIRDPQKKEVLGLMSTSGRDWTDLHHLVVRLLRIASEDIESVYGKHVKKLFKKLDDLEDGLASDAQELFSPLVLMVLWEILTGEDISEDCPDFQQFTRKNKEFFRSGNILTNSVMFTSYLRRLLPLFSSFRRFRDANGALLQMITAAVNRRKAVGFNTSCFIDGYLREIHKGDGNNCTHPFLTESCLTVTLMDIFNAGAESTGNAIGFALLRLLHLPDIYRNLTDELIVASPQGGEKIHFPYLEAFLMEVLRTSSVAPLSLPHLAARDTRLMNDEGFIEEGSIIVANLWSVHHDASQWKEPKKFSPERHLVDGKLVKSQHFIPYGIGKRACPGETISQYIYKNTVLRLLKRYDVLPAGELPSMEPVKGFTLSPQPFDLRLRRRNS